MFVPSEFLNESIFILELETTAFPGLDSSSVSASQASPSSKKSLMKNLFLIKQI